MPTASAGGGGGSGKWSREIMDLLPLPQIPRQSIGGSGGGRGGREMKTTYQKFGDAAKAELRGKFTALQAVLQHYKKQNSQSKITP